MRLREGVVVVDGSAADDRRWAAHPVLGGVLRVAVIVVPVLVGLVAGVALARLLPIAHSVPGRIGWYAAVLGGSLAALLLSDRVARRVLPLVVLLELSLVFPDRAPSRLRAARTPSVREIEKKMLALRRDGISSEPIETAETLVTLVGILGVHDKRTRGHSERVRAFTDLLTDELRLDDDDRMRLRWAALVHDLGKLMVPGRILNGGRDLSAEDWATIRRHPDEGQRLAAGLLPWLGEWGSAVVGHHERWDGSGYPAGLAGADIGYGARIVAVADAFEVMTSARSYHRPRSAAAAREELTRCAGTQFDPQVVRAFLGISVGRLRWILGPVTWLAQLPFAAAADRAGQAAKGAATAATVGGLVVVGVVPGPGGRVAVPAVVAKAAAAPAAAGPQAPGSLVPGGGLSGGSTGVPPAPPAGPVALPFTEPDPSAPQGPVVPVPLGPTGASGPVPPAQGPTVPAQGPTVPAQGPTVPAQGPTVPAQGPTVPEQGPTVPEQGPTVPARGPAAPTTQGPTVPRGPKVPTQSPTVPAPAPPVPRPVPPGPPGPVVPTAAPVVPTAAPVVSAAPVPSLSPPVSPSPSPDPSVPATPSPSPTASPSRSPGGVPALPPVPALRGFYLGAGGVLRPGGPGGAAGTVRLAVGASTSYDLVVPVRTALAGSPHLFVHVLVEGKQGKDGTTKGDGHGRLLATLSDCAGACTVLSTGHVEVKKHHHDAGPQLEDGKLKRVEAVLEAGHTLRLTLELDKHGNATSVLLLEDGSSRLDLSTAPTSPVAVAGLGLAALVLLGGLAARPQ